MTREAEVVLAWREGRSSDSEFGTCKQVRLLYNDIRG
jgi:hypothetical protein